MNGFPTDKQSRLLELLGQQQEAFEQIREMTRKHKELLETDDIDEFDRSLDDRQGLIEKINGLHQESDILMQSYISISGTGGGQKIDAIESSAALLAETIADCAALNDEITVSAKEKAEDYIKQIGKLSLSRKSLGAYVQNVPNNPELFDKMT